MPDHATATAATPSLPKADRGAGGRVGEGPANTTVPSREPPAQVGFLTEKTVLGERFGLSAD